MDFLPGKITIGLYLPVRYFPGGFNHIGHLGKHKIFKGWREGDGKISGRHPFDGGIQVIE